MKRISLLLLTVLATHCCFSQTNVDTTQQITAGRKNSIAQQKKPYVILISADGFRYDFAKRYHANNLLKLGGGGVSASAMIPSYPSVTFPNHYAMVSGLYPSHSGLVNNTFYDRDRKDRYSMSAKDKVADGSWYGGAPLWVRAEQQGMLSASFYWVASEAKIGGILPTYYYIYNEKIDIHNRIQAVVDWLKLPAEKRPHFISFYFPQVDHAAHHFGPESPEAEKEVLFIDSAVNELQKAVRTTGLKDVNFVFVSDHGMARVDNEHPLSIPAAIDTSKYVISGDGILVELYAKNKADVPATYNALKKEARDYDVYLKSNVPARWHYGEVDDWHNRIGDILLVPHFPKVFNRWNSKKRINPGWHGYDPAIVKEMQATFFAWGPAFKKHLNIVPFKNVSVFNLVSNILGITHTDKIDGTDELPRKILTGKTKKRK